MKPQITRFLHMGCGEPLSCCPWLETAVLCWYYQRQDTATLYMHQNTGRNGSIRYSSGVIILNTTHQTRNP